MRISACPRKLAWLLAALLAPGLHAEQGLLTFVFGPNSPDAGRQSAHAAAAVARHWAETDGGVVEVRRGGSPDVQSIEAAAGPKEVDQKFAAAVLAARDVDPPSFLITLESAAQAASMHPGARVVVAILNSPSFSTEGERTLKNLGEFCQARGVRILVLDLEGQAKSAPNAALKALAAQTGGAWMREAKDLGPQVAMVTPPDETSIAPGPAGPLTTVAKTSAATAAGGAALRSEIPIEIRFIRTSGTGSTSETMTSHEADFGAVATLSPPSGFGAVGSGITIAAGSAEVSYEPSDSHAPLQGLVTVESPLNALTFDKDDSAGTYQGHAVITATVRDAKGATVWTGKRDVSIHGPLPKLAFRREGSMYFMRAVTLVGQGPYTLEAKVEDLLANKVGMIQTPLRVGRNAPGLVATDALVVRPFKGAADKFEADQVLSYDGDALSPVLDPVFQAGQQCHLQIYLRLYPDIHGSPIDMDMEVLHEGRVVTRMPLPFKGGLASMAREGGSSAVGGRSDNMYGGQAKEFPYLADLNAKFPAGDYQAVISIHQGSHVIRRVVPFKVVGLGGADAPVEIAKVSMPGPGGPTADDAEAASAVLPEIEMASIDATGLKMRVEDQKQLWEAAGKGAMGYLDQLPNFRCTQETHRFTASVKTPDQLKEADSYRDELIFEDGKERYQRLETNGEKVDNAPVKDTGISSRHEFGTMLRGVFDSSVSAAYHWAGRSMAMGVLCQVFEIEVAKAKSNFSLHYDGVDETASYTGRVFIDDETGLVRRLTIQGGGLRKDFGLQSPALSLDYGMVKIGETDYLLPLRSVLQLRRGKVFVRNETVFRDYRKFQADSQIKFGK